MGSMGGWSEGMLTLVGMQVVVGAERKSALIRGAGGSGEQCGSRLKPKHVHVTLKTRRTVKIPAHDPSIVHEQRSKIEILLVKIKVWT